MKLHKFKFGHLSEKCQTLKTPISLNNDPNRVRLFSMERGGREEFFSKIGTSIGLMRKKLWILEVCKKSLENVLGKITKFLNLPPWTPLDTCIFAHGLWRYKWEEVKTRCLEKEPPKNSKSWASYGSGKLAPIHSSVKMTYNVQMILILFLSYLDFSL